MIRVKIVPNDSGNVVKAIIIDDNKRVLFLKRSGYVDKFAGEWDLYTNKPIKISHEHTGFRFFSKGELDANGKFEKMAIKALEMEDD